VTFSWRLWRKCNKLQESWKTRDKELMFPVHCNVVVYVWWYPFKISVTKLTILIKIFLSFPHYLLICAWSESWILSVTSYSVLQVCCWCCRYKYFNRSEIALIESQNVLTFATKLITHLHIQKVLGSYLDPETGYPDWGFSCSSPSPEGKFQDSMLNYRITASCVILSYLLFVNHLVIWRCIFWAASCVIK